MATADLCGVAQLCDRRRDILAARASDDENAASIRNTIPHPAVAMTTHPYWKMLANGEPTVFLPT